MNNKKQISQLTDVIRKQNRRIEDFLEKLEIKSNNHQNTADPIRMAA